MKKALLLCACLLSLNANAENNEVGPDYTSFGIATLTCAELLQFRKTMEASVLDATVAGTLQGFMTAMSYERGVRLSSFPVEDIKNLLYNSCDENPTENVSSILFITAEFFIKNSKTQG